MKLRIISMIGLILFGIQLITPSVFADSWFVGKGLKQGDYFRYNVCYIEYYDCSPLEIDFWVQNKTSDGNWNLQFLTLDGSILHEGIVTIGSNVLDPINYNSNLTDYARVFKNTIVWLDSVATSENPKDFSYPIWFHNGVQGSGMGPIGQEQVTVVAGTFDTWIIAGQRDVTNKIWIDPNLPFPVKAKVYADTITLKFYYNLELLETGNSPTSPMNQFLTIYSAQNNVPEFGSLAGMIIVISVIGVILLSRFKFHL